MPRSEFFRPLVRKWGVAPSASPRRAFDARFWRWIGIPYISLTILIAGAALIDALR